MGVIDDHRLEDYSSLHLLYLDMQAERDHLVTIVFLKLRPRVKRYHDLQRLYLDLEGYRLVGFCPYDEEGTTRIPKEPILSAVSCFFKTNPGRNIHV